MNVRLFCRHFFAAAALAITAVSSATAQHLLYAKTDAGPRLVKRVSHNTPWVDDGTGKLVRADRQYMLQRAPEFLPVFVSLRDVQVKTSALHLLNGGGQLNREFHFKAKLESAIPLDDVYVVFDLNNETSGHAIWVQEVGRLPAHELEDFAVVVPVSEDVSRGKFFVYVFAGGLEVLNSRMPQAQINAGYAKIIAHKIKGVTDAAPQPLIGPAPEYPSQLRKKKVHGQAVISCHISTKGEVLDPVVKSASDPAFGEAALAAAREWRFIPRVVDGKPVNAPADLPFEFSPEEKTAAN